MTGEHLDTPYVWEHILLIKVSVKVNVWEHINKGKSKRMGISY